MNGFDAYNQGVMNALKINEAQEKFRAEDLNRTLKQELLPLQLKAEKIKLATGALPDRKLMLALASRDQNQIQSAIADRQQLANIPVGASSLEISDRLGNMPISEFLAPGELDLLKKQADFENTALRLGIQNQNRLGLEEVINKNRTQNEQRDDSQKKAEKAVERELGLAKELYKKFGKAPVITSSNRKEILGAYNALKTQEAKDAFKLMFAIQLPKALAEEAAQQSIPDQKNQPPSEQPPAPKVPSIPDGQVKTIKGTKYRFSAKKNLWEPI